MSKLILGFSLLSRELIFTRFYAFKQFISCDQFIISAIYTNIHLHEEERRIVVQHAILVLWFRFQKSVS